MDNELYVKNDDDVKYWTREQLLARAEAAEKMAGQWLQLVTLRDNLIFELEAQLESETAQRLAAERRIAELKAQLAELRATMAAEVNIGESQTYRTS